MNLSIGIVGLPNVGKSTLFNALLKQQTALVANYPFATIEPNIGVVPVPDKRLLQLAQIEKQEYKMDKLPPIIPATVSFVDIAGLVKGASEGEGLGNKFLSHIREVDAIVEVTRYFRDSDIHHVSGEVNPESDKEIIATELILADIQTLEKQHTPKRNATKEDLHRWSAILKLKVALNNGNLAKDVALNNEEAQAAKHLHLITAKPIFYVANVSEEQLHDEFSQDTIAISAKVEQELSELAEEDQKEYLEALGLTNSGLEKIIKKGYEVLNLISFLTSGEKEVRAWTINRGTNAVQAAGVIHTDFMKAFIKAEIIAFQDFIELQGRKKAKELGKARLEGKEYIVQDGDVIEFKIGAT